MENKEFDDIIKKKLESLNSVGSDDGWKVFRKKWQGTVVNDDISEGINEDFEGNADDLFDAKLKQNLQNLRVPFNSAHWIRLKLKLEAEALFRKRLFVAKTVEILMLALIVIGVLNIWPIQQATYQIPIDGSPMVASIPVDKATAEKYHQEESGKITESLKILRTSFPNNKVADKLSQILPSTKVLSGSNTNPSILERSNQNKKVQEDLIEGKDLKSILPFIESINNQNNGTLEQKRGNQIFAGLGPNNIEEIEIPVRPTGYPDITVPLRRGNLDEHSYLSVSIGPRLALVNSPFDPVYKLDPYNTFNTNFNISAKISKEIGPIEVYTGVGYTSINYKPQKVTETFTANSSEFGEASLDDISFKSINIPVGVKYNVIDKPVVQLYAAAGLDLNIVAESDFKIIESSFNNRFGPAPVPDNFSGNSSNVNRNSLLSQKEFNPGILNGGTLGDNLYASAHIGIGIAANVSKNISLFVEPKYNHYISSQGIGPNQDKVHGVSIDLGVRYQLN